MASERGTNEEKKQTWILLDQTWIPSEVLVDPDLVGISLGLQLTLLWSVGFNQEVGKYPYWAVPLQTINTLTYARIDNWSGLVLNLKLDWWLDWIASRRWLKQCRRQLAPPQRRILFPPALQNYFVKFSSRASAPKRDLQASSRPVKPLVPPWSGQIWNLASKVCKLLTS